MDILIQPSSLSLVGSMNRYVIYATTDISFVLSDNASGEVIVQHTYTPSDTNRIEIDLKNIILPLLLFKLQDASSPYQQTDIVKTFKVVVTEVKTDGTTGASKTSTFTVLRGGVDHFDGDTTSFLQQNFLTWQPNVKPVTYYTPEFLTYYATVAATVRCKAYLEGGTTKEFALAQFSAGQCWTIPVQYAIIAGKCGSQMPMYYDVWVENGSGQRMTYIQRYYATDMRSEEEEWILFENSLGGIDTFRAYGDSENTAEHTHNVAEIEEDFEEYRVDTTRKFKKNTGHLGKKERTWLLDFFPSLGKYIYVSSYIRRIVVTDSDVSYHAKELPSTYNFTYKYADARPYLNIPRVDTPQTVLNIKVPELGSFTIAPRLVEFPRLTLSGGALFPVQNPYSEQWTVTTAAAILEYLIHALEADYSGGGGIGHTHPNISLLNGLYLLEDYLLVNGNKIKAGYADVAKNLSDDSPIYRKFIRKDQDDRTNYNLGVGGTLEVDRDLNVHGDAVIDGSLDVGIRTRTKELDVTDKATIEELQVNGDSVFAGAMSSPLFRSGFLDGYGWALFKKVVENALGVKEDKYTLEIDNLIVRQSMRVFEMIVSQLLGENDNRVFAAMMEVDHYDQASGKVYFNNHDGKLYNPFRKHDYIEVQQYNPAATDGWVIKHYELVIAEVGTGYEDGERVDWVKFYGFVSASGATAAELIAQGDTFTRVDNAVDEERKGIVTVTSVGAKTPYIDIIYGLKSDPEHSLKGRIGNLEGLRTPQFGWLKGFGEYLNNLYAVGHFKMAATGENVSARIEANESRLASTYSETLYNIKEEDNLLQNGMFTRGLDEWGVCDLDSLEEIENELSTQEQQSNLVTVSDGTTIAPMFLNGGTVGQKHKSHVVAETFDGTQVLHLYEVGIFQHWSKMRANGTHDIVEPVAGEEDQYRTKAVANTLFFSIRFLAKTSGVLKLEFFDDNSGWTAVRTWNITASDEWQIRQVDDKGNGWFYDPNENGRLIVTYSGEIILRFVTLMNSPLDDYKQTVSTQFIQTANSIQLLGQKYTALDRRLTNLGIELNADLESIRLYVDTTTEAMEQRLELRIDGVDGKVELYAEKLENDYYDKSAIDVKIGEISSLVAGIQTDLADQETIIEQIRNLAIDAANAEVYTQATNPWSQWTGGTEYKHVGAVWHYILESGVTTSPTFYLIDGTPSHPDVGKTYRYVGYDNSNKWEPIDDIAASASYILQTKDYISAVVANFDEDGNVLESSGIVITAYGNKLYASKEVPSANLLLGSGTGVNWQLNQYKESAYYVFTEATRQFAITNYFPIGETAYTNSYHNANLLSPVMMLKSGQKYVLSFNVMKGSNVTFHLQFAYGSSASSQSIMSGQTVAFADAIDDLATAIANGEVTDLADAMAKKRPVRIKEYDDGSYYRYFYVFTAQNTYLRMYFVNQILSTEVTSNTTTSTTYESGTISSTTTNTTVESQNNGRTRVTKKVTRSYNGTNSIKVETETTTQTAKSGTIWLRRLQLEKAVNSDTNDIRPSEYKEEQTMIESFIKQTAESIEISASRIHLEGVVTANQGFKIDTDGSIEATKGTIGGWTIESSRLVCTSASGARICLEPSGTRFLRINYSDDTLMAMRADGITGLYIYTHDTSGVCLRMNAQAGGTAIRSYGRNSFISRSEEGTVINGFSFAPVVITSGGTIGSGSIVYSYDGNSFMPNLILVDASSDIELTLPSSSSVSDGRIIFIRKLNNGNITVKSSSVNILNNGHWSEDYQQSLKITHGQLQWFIWCAQKKCWISHYVD